MTPARHMKEQAHVVSKLLDNIEAKTGLTPRQFIDLAHERGFDTTSKATPILDWLKQDYNLGRGRGGRSAACHHQGPADQRQARGRHRHPRRRERHPLARG